MIGFSRRLIARSDLRFTVNTVSASSCGSSGGGMAGSFALGSWGTESQLKEIPFPVAR